MSYCTQCGQQISEQANFCHKCGKMVNRLPIVDEQSNDYIMKPQDKENDNVTAISLDKEDLDLRTELGESIIPDNAEIKSKKTMSDYFLEYKIAFIVILLFVGVGIGTVGFYSYSSNNSSPEQWIKANQDVLDVVMQNQVNLTRAGNHYNYYLQLRDMSIFDRMIDKAQNAQQKIKENTNNEETEKIRQEVNRHLIGQIDAFKFYKKCILSNTTEDSYRTGSSNFYVMQHPITDRTSSIGIILNKYGIDATDMFKKAIK